MRIFRMIRNDTDPRIHCGGGIPSPMTGFLHQSQGGRNHQHSGLGQQQEVDDGTQTLVLRHLYSGINNHNFLLSSQHRRQVTKNRGLLLESGPV